MNGLEPVVTTVIDEKIQAGSMFTAYDITLEVRKRGHKAKHDDVRDIVHDYYGRGSMGVAYTRTSITVSTGTPFLYHRTIDDPNTYNIAVNAVPQNNTIVTPAFTSNPAAGHNFIMTPPSSRFCNSGKCVGRLVDARGSLTIPIKVVVNAGLKHKDKVFATKNGDDVEIIKAEKNNLPTTTFAKYTVNLYNQIRITKNFLKKVGLACSSYDVSDSNNVITVKLHN